MPKISIITPIYCDIDQKIDWLDETIQSVRSQSVTDWEMILIDDKSPLSLSSVRMEYMADSRIRWFENVRNYGPAMTRNTAVTLAESECILPLDSDDMLANNETLEYMYDAWIMDRTKTIYGDVQLYKLSAGGSYKRGKVHQLAHYSFEGATNLEFGVMPVTTMHSKEAHYAAGGWKAVLNHGREDMEYWIACGRAGYCGYKIKRATLLYRKHEYSRDYKLKFELKEVESVQQKIKSMHADIYKGVFPVGCCGKGRASAPVVDPVVMSKQANQEEVRYITTLEGYDEKDLEWVAYQGPKRASAGRILVRGPKHLPSEYPILGTGHFFQIHKSHKDLFSQRAKLEFRVNVGDPREQPEPEPQLQNVVEIAPEIKEVPKPEMSTIVRLDSIAAKTREVDIQEIVEPIVTFEHEKVTMPEKAALKFHLADLGLSASLTNTLLVSDWTIEKLAKATPQKLSSLPGIGIKRADIIIAKAQKLINKT